MISLSRVIWVVLALLVGALAIWHAGYRVADSAWRARWSTRDARAAADQQARSRQVEQERQRAVAELDARYTGEMANANAKIAGLERAVAAGQRRLRVHTLCGTVSGATPGAALADAARAGLTDTAQRDYFTLRKRIELARTQIEGLQGYIRNVCRAHEE